MIINIIPMKFVVNVRFPLYSILFCHCDGVLLIMNRNAYLRLCAPYVTAISFLLAVPSYIEAAVACEAPNAVCEWRERIVGIKTPNMIASGILIKDGQILTNRHVVEDHQSILVKNFDGSIEKAEVIPHDVPVDLAIVNSGFKQIEPDLAELIAKTQSQTLYVVAFDQGRNSNRVYKHSTFALYPELREYPTSRIHSNSKALPGNSGGAVVNEHGMLVGVLASGDHRISEIIPAKNIEKVLGSMDALHKESFSEIGGFIRRCADALHASASILKDPPNPIISKIERNCLKSKNKQLLDQAGQTFGRWWMFDISEKFLRKSEKLDPRSPNTLMSLAVNYHLSRKPKQAIDILKRYLELDPSNQQALRLSIQNAGIVRDRDFADKALDLMKRHNPSALPLANSYIENAFSD